MDLIQINIKECNPKPEQCELLAVKLDWCEINKESHYDSLDLKNSAEESIKKLSEINFDYIIGSDIVYWPTSINPLMNMINVYFAIYLQLSLKI